MKMRLPKGIEKVLYKWVTRVKASIKKREFGYVSNPCWVPLYLVQGH